MENNQIDNTFYQHALAMCSIPVAAVDTDDTLRWNNQAFETLCGVEKDALIGVSVNAENQPALQTMFGPVTTLQIKNSDNHESWFIRNEQTINQQNNDSLRVCYFIPQQSESTLLAENSALKQQLEKLNLKDDLTGLANERALSQHLAAQVSRTRRYGNPLSLVLLDMELIDLHHPYIPDEADNRAIVTFSHYLRERLRWADFVARCNGGRFIIVLPETDEGIAATLFDSILQEKHEIKLSDQEVVTLKLNYGLAQWEKGNDPRMLVDRAVDALNAGA